jgi:poly-gamma-glutamate capsule biosynthesis protein CapA/YwtB (metallophosphatase superfamily)
MVQRNRIPAGVVPVLLLWLAIVPAASGSGKGKHGQGTTQTTPSTSNVQSGTEVATRNERGQESRQNNDQIKFVAVGDVMLGSSFPDDSGLPPNDGVDLLQEVAPLLRRGDITFGNLEGPLVDGGKTKKCGRKIGTCYAFRVPTRYGIYLKSAGFTVMGLANNHAMDFGLEGRASSRSVLDSLGILHSGEIGDVARMTAKGKSVVLIAFATYQGTYNLLELDDAIATVRQLRTEVDIVIVSFHGGAEGATHQHVLLGDESFLGEDRGDLRRFAHAMIDAGAQLVVGSGPHVVRGMEVYCGKLIAYSLGNFATYGSFNLKGENGVSLILEVSLGSDGSFQGGSVYPVKQERPGGPKLDKDMSILPILRDLSKTDFPYSNVEVSESGNLSSRRWNYLDLAFPVPACGVFQYVPCPEEPVCR